MLYIYVTVCIVMLCPFTWKKPRFFVISSPLFIKKGRIRPAIWLGWSNHQEKLYFRSEETASGNSTYMVIFSRSSISMDHLYHSYATNEATSDLEFHLQSLTCNQVMQETPNIPWNLKIHSRRFPLWSTIVTISFTTNQKGILYIHMYVTINYWAFITTDSTSPRVSRPRQITPLVEPPTSSSAGAASLWAPARNQGMGIFWGQAFKGGFSQQKWWWNGNLTVFYVKWLYIFRYISMM